tara:strand:- start:26402 stop:26602 length:201 start_codon:yes stop_codon:yes gene_type:complete
MPNLINIIIFGVTSIILYKKINNKIKYKNLTDSTCQTDLSSSEIDKALLCKQDIDAINNGTYKWHL